jgi:hypothetical protein
LIVNLRFDNFAINHFWLSDQTPRLPIHRKLDVE